MTTQTGAMSTPVELGKAELLDILRRMWEIRIFENTVYDLLGQNIIKGASHLYAGQEAVAVGAIAALRDDDLITSTHRGHGHCHARGDSLAVGAEAKQEHLNKMMAELCGRAHRLLRRAWRLDAHRRRGKGQPGRHRHRGGQYPRGHWARPCRCSSRASTAAWSAFSATAPPTRATFTSRSTLASAWRLPVIYVVENNLYGMSVPFDKVSPLPDVAARAAAYDMPGIVLDGMDPHRRVRGHRGGVGQRPSWPGPHTDRMQDLPLVRPLAL
jgi:TPP-dependent pyruvate/acetoin dehydrogenase alpha subunit